jgi:hypothetical protein
VRRAPAGRSTSTPTGRAPPRRPLPSQFKEYLDRAEYIKGIISGNNPPDYAGGSNDSAQATAGPRPKGTGTPNGGAGGKEVRPRTRAAPAC